VALVAPERRETGLEVFLDGKQRKDLAALRHDRDAAARTLIRTQLGDVLLAEHDRALADRVLPGDGAQQAGLADAVAAEHAGDLAGLGLERHPAQRLRRAVMQIDRVDVEHGDHRPK
jgi:hypothetical protein